MWENKKHSIRRGEGHLNHGWEVPGKRAAGKKIIRAFIPPADPITNINIKYQYHEYHIYGIISISNSYISTSLIHLSISNSCQIKIQMQLLRQKSKLPAENFGIFLVRAWVKKDRVCFGFHYFHKLLSKVFFGLLSFHTFYTIFYWLKPNSETPLVF